MNGSHSRGKGAGVLVVAALVLCGCSATRAAEVEDVAAVQDGPLGLSPEVAKTVVDRIVPEIERIRGLAFKKAVPVEVVDDEFLRNYVVGRLRRFGQDAHLESLAKAYAALGLVPEGSDVVAMLLSAVEEQAGGFYDPASGSYYLMGDMPASAAPIFTAHELTHALEDQHFHLDDRLREVIDDDDRSFARSAVHEGSAVVAMSTYLAEAMMRGELGLDVLQSLVQSEADRSASLEELPPVLLRHLLGPYLLGANFLVRGNMMNLAQGFPVESVNRAFRDGPVSSEQILHPEKYWDPGRRDDPREVTVPGAGALLGEGWKLVGEGVVGEVGLAPLVGAATSIQPTPTGVLDASSWSHDASEGWDGDRWQLWEGSAGTLVLFVTVWDSPEDAKEFAGALPATGRLRWARDADRVAIVAGDPSDRTAALLSKLLERGEDGDEPGSPGAD